MFQVSGKSITDNSIHTIYIPFKCPNGPLNDSIALVDRGRRIALVVNIKVKKSHISKVMTHKSHTKTNRDQGPYHHAMARYKGSTMNIVSLIAVCRSVWRSISNVTKSKYPHVSKSTNDVQNRSSNGICIVLKLPPPLSVSLWPQKVTFQWP